MPPTALGQLPRAVAKPPARPQAQDQIPPPGPTPVNGPPKAMHRPGSDLSEREQYVCEQLMNLSNEQKKNPDIRQPLNMPPQEKEALRQSLTHPPLKALIQKTSYLLPAFLLLGGEVSNARELSRRVKLSALSSWWGDS